MALTEIDLSTLPTSTSDKSRSQCLLTVYPNLLISKYPTIDDVLIGPLALGNVAPHSLVLVLVEVVVPHVVAAGVPS